MTAFCTVNGHAALSCNITMPRVGVWHADVVLEDGVALDGAVKISYSGGALNLSGSVRNAGVALDSGEALVVGGAGGLPSAMAAKSYKDSPLKRVLDDICAASGEKLSARISPDVLQRNLSFWTVTKGTAGQALNVLLQWLPELTWRILTDGSLWVGEESWGHVKLAYDVLHQAPADGKIVLDMDVPIITPGTTFEGLRVSAVEHHLDENGKHTVLYFEDVET